MNARDKCSQFWPCFHHCMQEFQFACFRSQCSVFPFCSPTANAVQSAFSIHGWSVDASKKAVNTIFFHRITWHKYMDNIHLDVLFQHCWQIPWASQGWPQPWYDGNHGSKWDWMAHAHGETNNQDSHPETNPASSHKHYAPPRRHRKLLHMNKFIKPTINCSQLMAKR